MKNSYSWFLAALVAGTGVYFMVDANESVRNVLSVLAFFIFALYGQAEDDRAKLQETNKRLGNKLLELQDRLGRLEQ